MDKIAFFYNLGYRTTLEKIAQSISDLVRIIRQIEYAFNVPQTPFEHLEPKVTEFLKRINKRPEFVEARDLMKFFGEHFKGRKFSPQQIYQARKTLEDMTRVYRAARSGAKIKITPVRVRGGLGVPVRDMLLGMLPVATIGLGYGAYRLYRRMTKPKSRIGRIRRALGFN